MNLTPRERAKLALEWVATRFWLMVNDGVSSSKGLSSALVSSEYSCVNSLSIFFFFITFEHPYLNLIECIISKHVAIKPSVMSAEQMPGNEIMRLSLGKLEAFTIQLCKIG